MKKLLKLHPNQLDGLVYNFNNYSTATKLKSAVADFTFTVRRHKFWLTIVRWLTNPRFRKGRLNQDGFTLIEVILAVSLFSIVATLLLVNIARPKGLADIQSTEDLIYTTIKEAQSSAMVGPGNNYGVHFEQDKFTLFKGAIFSPTDPNNLETSLNTNLTIESINLPSGGGNDSIVFSQSSGEVQGLSLGGSGSFVLRESNSGVVKTFTVTSLGAVDVN